MAQSHLDTCGIRFGEEPRELKMHFFLSHSVSRIAAGIARACLPICLWVDWNCNICRNRWIAYAHTHTHTLDRGNEKRKHEINKNSNNNNHQPQNEHHASNVLAAVRIQQQQQKSTLKRNVERARQSTNNKRYKCERHTRKIKHFDASTNTHTQRIFMLPIYNIDIPLYN